MKAIFKMPGCDPEVIDIPDTQEALREKVGENAEEREIAVDACVICDAKWRTKSEYAFSKQVICGMMFGGPILVVGKKGNGLCDLPQPEVVKELIWPSQRGRER